MMVPMVVTLVGIVTDVSPEHDVKAYGPNDRVSDDKKADKLANTYYDGDDSTDISNSIRNSN